MITNKTKSTTKATEAQGNSNPTQAKAKAIKLGIDVHLDRYVVEKGVSHNY